MKQPEFYSMKPFLLSLVILVLVLGVSVENLSQIVGGAALPANYPVQKSAQFVKSFVLQNDSLTMNLYPYFIPSSVMNKRIWFIKEHSDYVWIGDDSITIARSSNLKDWEILNKGISGEGINYIEFLDNNTIFAAGQGGCIFKSTDEGKNWVTVYKNLAETNYINKIKFFDNMNGIAHGDQAQDAPTMALLNTTDGGMTWRNFNSFLVGYSHINGVEFENPSSVFLYGYYTYDEHSFSGLWKSTDRGMTWNFYTVGNSSIDSVTSLECIMFQNAFKGYAAKVDSTLWETDDGGISWTKIVKAATGINSIVPVDNSNTIYCLGWSGYIAKITFNPAVSVSEKFYETSDYFFYGDFPEEYKGYILDYYTATNTFYTTFQTATDVDGDKISAFSFKLSQNYPNPFNPETAISYLLLEYCNVSLRVFDVLGREITTLVDEFQKAGEYKVIFSGKTLSSGIYFCRLQAGKFTDVKKMILIR